MDRQRLRNLIGSADMEPSEKQSDTLAIAICTYFDEHMDRPKADPITDTGWSEWVTRKANEAIDEITDAVLRYSGSIKPGVT